MKLKSITTRYENETAQTSSKEYMFVKDTNGIVMQLVNIHPEIERQSFMGFGGAFTESAGYTLSRMSDEVYTQIINDYFGAEGLGYTYCRTHIDSCDFSLGNYSAVTDCSDFELATFSLRRDEEYIIPMIKRAIAVSRMPISLLLPPWSPPAFMKTNGQKNMGGKLKPEFRQMWAKYISRYIDEYIKRGINVTSITVQNEPEAVQTWDSCIYTAEEEGEFISEFLAQQLKADGHENIQILIWDHNKERLYERTRDTLAVGNCSKLVDGIAFHWYTGDHFEALDILRDKFPEKKLIFTEGCVEYSRPDSTDKLKNAQKYAHDIIGNLNSGMNAFIDWNLVLDEKGGPNHVVNYCDAPIMCNTIDNTYEKRLTYSYIGHFSRYIKPGAVRIGHSRYTDKLEVVAFKNTDGAIVVVVLNRTLESIDYTLRINNNICSLKAEPSSISTLLF